MRNPQPFLVCLFFLFPLATSFFIVDQQPEEESNDYNNAEENRGGSWQNSNMFRASKRLNFRATKRSSAEPDDFTTDNLLAGENDEKRVGVVAFETNTNALQDGKNYMKDVKHIEA